MKNLFPTQLPNQLLLVMGEHAASTWMLELAAWLAIQGRARVLDGGNRFNAYPVAHAVRRQNQDPRAALKSYSPFAGFHLLPGGCPANRMAAGNLSDTGV